MCEHILQLQVRSPYLITSSLKIFLVGITRKMQICAYMQRNSDYDLFCMKLSSKKLKPLQHHMESWLILLTSTTTYDKVESSFFSSLCGRHVPFFLL